MSPLRTTEGRPAERTSILVMGEGRDHSLSELARHAGDLLVSVRGDEDASIRGLSYDSRAVGPGDLFFCVPGMRTDGHRYAAAAVGSGAVGRRSVADRRDGDEWEDHDHLPDRVDPAS